MKVCILGLGYIGLPTSAVFSSIGCEVVGVDVFPSIVDTLNSGKIHIEEPGLEEIIAKAVQDGTFRASLVPEQADVFIVTVPTPNFDDEFKSCDLSYVIKASSSIVPFLKKGNVVVIESTVAPRSTEDFIKPIFEEAGFTIGEDLFLAHCPERVLPGQILYEIIYNNRIVGGITPACTEKVAAIYEKFVKGTVYRTEAKTAELSKCMENTFRDVNIALANELAKICYKLDINCLEVIELANKHPRVNIHQPGPGVGGHCLAIDPYFICAKAPDEAKIIRLARDTNTSMPAFVVGKIKMLLRGIGNPKIAALGVTYKGNVDDRRESPALEIVHMLKMEGFNVDVFDPHVDDKDYVDLETAAKDADIMVVLVDHNEYKDMDHEKLAGMMKNPILFDTKNIIKEQADSGLQVINFGNLYKHKK